MKKILFSLVLLLGVLGLSEAREFGAPVDQAGYPAVNNSYAGVDYSTVSLSSANVQMFTGEGVVVGFVASSGPTTVDYYHIIFRDTETVTSPSLGAGGDYLNHNEIARVLVSTTAVSNLYQSQATPLGSSYLFPAPIHVWRGATAKCSSNAVHMITYLWHRYRGVSPTGK